MSNFTLQKYLDNKKIEYSYTQKGNQINLKVCPECGDDKWHCYIAAKQTNSIFRSHPYLCHKCEARGNIIGLIMAVDGLTRGMAIKFLMTNKKRRNHSDINKLERKNLILPQYEDEIEQLTPIKMLKEFKPLEKSEGYTKERGLTDEIVQYFQLHMCNEYLSYDSIVDSGFVKENDVLTPNELTEKYGKILYNRLIIPVVMNGELVGWQGRSVGKRIPKYLNSMNFKKSKVLYNYDVLAESVSNTLSEAVILCEGPFDVMKCHVAGYRAVATFGKHVSPCQIGLLLRSGIKELIIGLDPDASVESAKLYKDLYSFFDVYVLDIPDNMDLGDCTPSMIDNILKSKYKIGFGLEKKSLT